MSLCPDCGHDHKASRPRWPGLERVCGTGIVHGEYPDCCYSTCLCPDPETRPRKPTAADLRAQIEALQVELRAAEDAEAAENCARGEHVLAPDGPRQYRELLPIVVYEAGLPSMRSRIFDWQPLVCRHCAVPLTPPKVPQ